MQSRNIRLDNETGLHLRPAGHLCELTSRYRARVTFEHQGQVSDAKSVLSVLAAGVKGGDTIRLCCEGPDEEAAMEAVTAMFLERLSGVIVDTYEDETAPGR